MSLFFARSCNLAFGLALLLILGNRSAQAQTTQTSKTHGEATHDEADPHPIQVQVSGFSTQSQNKTSANSPKTQQIGKSDSEIFQHKSTTHNFSPLHAHALPSSQSLSTSAKALYPLQTKTIFLEEVSQAKTSGGAQSVMVQQILIDQPPPNN